MSALTSLRSLLVALPLLTTSALVMTGCAAPDVDADAEESANADDELRFDPSGSADQLTTQLTAGPWSYAGGAQNIRKAVFTATKHGEYAGSYVWYTWGKDGTLGFRDEGSWRFGAFDAKIGGQIIFASRTVGQSYTCTYSSVTTNDELTLNCFGKHSNLAQSAKTFCTTKTPKEKRTIDDCSMFKGLNAPTCEAKSQTCVSR